MHKVLAHRVSIVHGVEGRDFVDSHWGHFEHASNLVHDADASEAMLALAEVQQRHDRGLLVLRGIPFEDFVDDFQVFCAELERDAGVIVGFVAVLEGDLEDEVSD